MMVDMSKTITAARRRAWKLLGSVIAHVPAVFDDETPVCAVTSSGAVRVDDGRDVVWYYRGTEIVRRGASCDSDGHAGARGYSTLRGYTRSSLTEVVASIDEHRALRLAKAGQ